MEYDWYLQVGDGASSMEHYSELHPFGFQEVGHHLLLPDSPEKFRGFTTADHFEQLEGLYKPFYPVFTPTIVTDSMSAPQDWEMMNKAERLKSLQSLTSQQPPAAVHAANPKKKRKNQQKRVVQQVREDGLRSDTWAWRKYGQKPIKGSPYPRSYYRCSSSKGCVARKQVERSCSDPTTFIITYTAEHNHNSPTRRSSLAGISKRKKGVEFVPLERSQSSTETAPNDPAAMEVEEKREVGVLEEGQKLGEAIMSKELVASLEDLEALLMDQTFLDVSPDYNWPIQDFATLIDGNMSYI